MSKSFDTPRAHLLTIFLVLFTVIVQTTSIFAQTTWEFSGTSYAFQKAHFDSATVVIAAKLGIQMRTFGAPYNQIDSTLLTVMSEDTTYKVLLFGEINPSVASGIMNLTNRVNMESATGVPDYNYFVTNYNTYKTTYTNYMVLQGHPYAWTTPTKQTDFQNIINFLVSEGVQFTTPYEYYKYVTDLSIPRTNKIQIILKLDDLRATTSYFTPCFPTYDFLAANDIKASFGVNNMSNLTQTQIDTLNHYLNQTDAFGTNLFEVWHHGLDHSMTAATTGGNWSSPSTWPSGYVPTAAEDVVIESGTTVTIDIANAACQNLTVRGTLVTSVDAATGLTVNGDVLISSGGSFTSPAKTGATANILHALTVYGDFTNSGGTFDFRMGAAGTTMRVINTTFTGNTNSTITTGTYSSGNNDFNGITVNKSGGAKIILGSDVTCDPGSSSCTSQLNLTSGIIQTGNFTMYALSTTSADILNASTSSYVNGALGRGMSNSVGKTNPFPVGDANGYRPITIKSTTAGTATGHHVIARCISGNANTGTTAFAGGIDTVSKIRYYQIGYNKGIGAGATTMGFNQFSPSYSSGDGIVAGNTNLRVAYSVDNMATWTGITQGTAHTTSIGSNPTTITPSTLASDLTLSSGTGSIYVALARATGTTNNPLPVELTSFSASLKRTSIVLNWHTASEINSSAFIVQRMQAKKTVSTWEDLANITAAGNSNTGKDYQFTDLAPLNGTNTYRLMMIDNDGSSELSTNVQIEFSLPAKFSLSQNFPNPFNPATTISYSLPDAGLTTLKVFAPTGELVTTLVNEHKDAGNYVIDFSLSGLSSGVYFYTLQSNGVSISKKMMYLQ